MRLPPCPPHFATRKATLLAELTQPDDAYADASPKGAVDVGIRPLLAAINAVDGLMTTSSCAGRVSVFMEGRRRPKRQLARPRETAAAEDASADADVTAETEAMAEARRVRAASSGGKGGGGRWLFVSHDSLVEAGSDNSSNGGDTMASRCRTERPPFASYSETDWASEFGLEADAGAAGDGEVDMLTGLEGETEDALRLVHFKFEPMILHVWTASLAHAQLVLRCAAAAGFRESGAVGLVGAAAAGDTDGRGEDGATPVVAVRSMGLALASVIGVCVGGVSKDEEDDKDDDGGHGAGSKPRAQAIVSRSYLAGLARVADRRFVENRARTERFRLALEAAVAEEAGQDKKDGKRAEGDGGWEDAEARRARKRAQGLQRQAALLRETGNVGRSNDGDEDGQVMGLDFA